MASNWSASSKSSDISNISNKSRSKSASRGTLAVWLILDKKKNDRAKRKSHSQKRRRIQSKISQMKQSGFKTGGSTRNNKFRNNSNNDNNDNDNDNDNDNNNNSNNNNSVVLEESKSIDTKENDKMSDETCDRSRRQLVRRETTRLSQYMLNNIDHSVVDEVLAETTAKNPAAFNIIAAEAATHDQKQIQAQSRMQELDLNRAKKMLGTLFVNNLSREQYVNARKQQSYKDLDTKEMETDEKTGAMKAKRLQWRKDRQEVQYLSITGKVLYVVFCFSIYVNFC